MICCSSVAVRTVFWFLPSFTVSPRLEASISTTSFLLLLSKNTMLTFVPVVAKNVARHTHHACQHFALHHFFTNLFVNTTLCGDKTRRHNNGSFSFFAQRENNVL